MKKKNLSYLFFTVMVALGISGCASTKDAADLAPRAMHDWEAGKTVTYNTTRVQNQVLEIPGQGVQEQPSSLSMALSVVSTGPFQFDVTVTDASVEGSQVSTDAVVGLSSAVQLDSQGRITSASGLEGNAYVTASGGEASFIADLQDLFLVLPDTPLTEGVSWSESVDVPFEQSGLTGTRSGKQDYSCKQLTTYNDTPAFEVEVSSEVTIIAMGNQGGGDMDITLEGILLGTVYVDAATGEMLSSEYSGTIEGGIDMAMGYLPMTLDLSMTTSRAE